MNMTFCRHRSQPSVPTVDIGTNRRHQLYSNHAHARGQCSFSFFLFSFSFLFSLSPLSFFCLFPFFFFPFSFFSLLLFLFFLSFSFLSFVLLSVSYRYQQLWADSFPSTVSRYQQAKTMKMTFCRHPSITVGADSRHWHRPSALTV